MPRFDKTEKRTIRGKEVSFSEKKLKNGKTAYYRDGKRVESYYQRRLARGVLEGKSVSEARGHPFGAYTGKLLSRSEIRAQEEFHIGNWAEPIRNDAKGRDRHDYYMKVSVTGESLMRQNRPGSPTGNEDACTPVTLKCRNPLRNEQDGFTYSEFSRNFEAIARFTLRKYGLDLCNGDLRQDLIRIWRHSGR